MRQFNGFICAYCRATPYALTNDHSSGVRVLADQTESCRGLRSCYSRCLMSSTNLSWTRLQNPKLPAEKLNEDFLSRINAYQRNVRRKDLNLARFQRLCSSCAVFSCNCIQVPSSPCLIAWLFMHVPPTSRGADTGLSDELWLGARCLESFICTAQKSPSTHGLFRTRNTSRCQD